MMSCSMVYHIFCKTGNRTSHRWDDSLGLEVVEGLPHLRRASSPLPKWLFQNHPSQCKCSLECSFSQIPLLGSNIWLSWPFQRWVMIHRFHSLKDSFGYSTSLGICNIRQSHHMQMQWNSI
jgi:hypothetical protein